MSIDRMRDSLDHVDPLGGLGPRVTPAPTPAPAPVPVAPGIVRHPDGRMETVTPENNDAPLGRHDPKPVEPVWPFPHTPAPAEPAADAADTGACCAREPLKVGDKLRFGNKWSDDCEHMRGMLVEVSKVDAIGRFWTSDDPDGSFMGYVDDPDSPGYWERVQ